MQVRSAADSFCYDMVLVPAAANFRAKPFAAVRLAAQLWHKSRCVPRCSYACACSEDDTIGDLKKMVAAQTGTRPDKIRIQKWYTVYKDHITLDDYEVHDGMNLVRA